MSVSLSILLVSGCSTLDSAPAEPKAAAPVELRSNIAKGATGVTVDTIVRAAADGGTIDNVELFYRSDEDKNAVAGEIRDAKWIAAQRLEPAQTYHLIVSGENPEGKRSTLKRTFTTQALTLDEQTYPSVAPLQGETVGVGMPVIVKFDLPVDNKAEFERHMSVTSTPAVEGSWSWLNDREAHFRPKEYWPAGTKVRLHATVNGLAAGNGVYGQQDQDIRFTIGRSAVSSVDIARHKLTVKIDGKVARTLPVTTGKDGFVTRSGTKVIMEKHDSLRMDAATVGVAKDDPEYYDLADVKYAMRVTNSGEFVHAAPWSQGSQGSANVSHGCVGLSVDDARWYYSQSRRGDIVKFVGSSRGLESQNGWTDWNISYDAFKRGSALD